MQHNQIKFLFSVFFCTEKFETYHTVPLVSNSEAMMEREASSEFYVYFNTNLEKKFRESSKNTRVNQLVHNTSLTNRNLKIKKFIQQQVKHHKKNVPSGGNSVTVASKNPKNSNKTGLSPPNTFSPKIEHSSTGPTVMKATACESEPCQPVAICIEIGSADYKCVCPAGTEVAMDGAALYRGARKAGADGTGGGEEGGTQLLCRPEISSRRASEKELYLQKPPLYVLKVVYLFTMSNSSRMLMYLVFTRRSTAARCRAV